MGGGGGHGCKRAEELCEKGHEEVQEKGEEQAVELQIGRARLYLGEVMDLGAIVVWGLFLWGECPAERRALVAPRGVNDAIVF